MSQANEWRSYPFAVIQEAYEKFSTFSYMS